MKQLIQTNERSYSRDINSKALINTNTEAYELHRVAKMLGARVRTLETRLEQLEQTVSGLLEANSR